MNGVKINKGIAALFLTLCVAATSMEAARITLVLEIGPADAPRPAHAGKLLEKSPMGGWVARTWPYSMRVGNVPVFRYQTEREQLLDASVDLQLGARSAGMDELLGDLLADDDEATEDPGAAAGFQSGRRASVVLDLQPGAHTLAPFGIAFEVGANGVPTSADPRVRVDAARRVIAVQCHPVVLRTVSDGRTLAAPLRVAVDGQPLLAGMEGVLGAYEAYDPTDMPPVEAQAFLRLTLFLPASKPGSPYTVNDTRFTLEEDGSIRLLDTAHAQLAAPNEIRLAAEQDRARPASVTPAAQVGGSGSVSLFTSNNRGIFRRGDRVEIFWTLFGGDRVPDALDIVVRGEGLTLPHRVALRNERGDALRRSGRIVLDATGLAPGAYTAEIQGQDLAVYPARFRIVQREPLSTYELYSYVYGQAMPVGGSPLNAFYGSLPANEGLAPFLADADVSLDAARAGEAGTPGGPAAEKFLRPSAADKTLMMLAAQGMRAVLDYPSTLYHEDWNPKHTLAEELNRMRRRLGLFVQPMADVAGLGGIALGWYASLTGYWEDVPRLDGHQEKRNAAANEWLEGQVAADVARAQAAGVSGAQLERLRRRSALRHRSSILPQAFGEYLADAWQIRPDLTAHNAIPSWWLGGGQGYAPYAYATLTQRDSVDYSDYGITAWGNFRTPAWMNMGNPDGQRLHANFMANQPHNRIVSSFGAAGRGLDGISMPVDGRYPQGQDEALLRIFERFGAWFSAFDPLPDVAVYNTDTNPQNVLLHDLARMRRPGMLLGQEDVLAAELEKYRVLFLVSAGEGEPDAVLEAFRAFESRGGVIFKDRTSHASLPGRDLGFGYAGDQVHPVWGLAYANGEDEFAHLWTNFKQTREPYLVEAFASIPGIPVTTPDSDVVISPLAGKESIVCFVLNQTLVPTTVPGRWRQYFVLPKASELQVEAGWHVHDILAGTSATVEQTADGQRIELDFSRAEGAAYLLTKRVPTGMAMRTVRTGPYALDLRAWLHDADDDALPDPMPFEVTLSGPEDRVWFRSFTALGPERPLSVPLPMQSESGPLSLRVQDLVLGSESVMDIHPAVEEPGVITSGPDLVDPESIAAFLMREGPITVLLDEGQAAYRRAAVGFVELMRRRGREVRIRQLDPADIRVLPLRWHPTAADEALREKLRRGEAIAWRADLRNVTRQEGNRQTIVFDDPASGYAEYGPRLWIEGDVVLFGETDGHIALEDLRPWLRRVVSPNYPAPGDFFIQHLWSPFHGGDHGLYIGCRDAAGAEAAVMALARLSGPPDAVAAEPPAAEPVITRGGPPQALENLLAGTFGRRILDVAFAPGGDRVFATLASYGDQLLALSPDGDIESAHAVHHHRDGLYRAPSGGLTALDRDTVRVEVGGLRYRYSLKDGWIGRAVVPSTGFTGRFRVPVAAATILENASGGHVFLGGARYVHALDAAGVLLWRYDDADVYQDTDALLYPRSLFPRAVSGDGRVLLVAGFGIQHDAYSLGRAENASVIGLDVASGALLWRHDGTLLNEGTAIALQDRFLLVDDHGVARILRAADGREVARLPAMEGAERIVPIPGRNALLLVENTLFDRDGPTARLVLRPIEGGADRLLDVPGRITDLLVMPDGDAVIVATKRGETRSLAAADGRLLWRAVTPSGGILRLAPDGRTLWVGTDDGVLLQLDAATGRLMGKTDLNPYHMTTAERFVAALGSVGELPDEPGYAVPPDPPEPSYRDVFDPSKVAFGRNLIADAPADGAPEGFAFSQSFAVEAGTTYLVELLAAVALPEHLTPHTRMEVVVKGRGMRQPLTVFLPLGRDPARRRAAFRANETGPVTLTLRAVEPVTTGEGRTARLTYEGAVASEAGLRTNERVVAAIRFPGRNLLFDGGPGSGDRPAGSLTCEVKPWTGGSSLVRNAPYPCPNAALRLVNGRITGDDTAWTTEVRGTDIEYAEGRIRFDRPQMLSAIVVYEDPTGPVPRADRVEERTAMHYGIYIRQSGSRDWQRIGHVAGNRQLINIFECPPVEIEEVRYFWAGRNDAHRTDGFVRAAQIEAYAADDLQDLLELDF